MDLGTWGAATNDTDFIQAITAPHSAHLGVNLADCRSTDFRPAKKDSNLC